MILHSLYDYYQRKASDSDGGMEPPGFVWKDIPFVVVIEKDGKFLRIQDTREGDNKKAKSFLLPKPTRKSSVEATLLWDNIGYLFGISKGESEKEIKLSKKQNKSWRASLIELDEKLKNISSVAALIKFYLDEKKQNAMKTDALWLELIKKKGANAVFRVEGDPDPIPCLEPVREYVRKRVDSKNNADNSESDTVSNIRNFRCLITGEVAVIAPTHTKTAISKDNNSLVSFQKDSGYDSYGKIQGYNAPVSCSAESAYTSALNALLRKDSNNKVLVGDSVTVFWSERKTFLEDNFFSFWNDKDNPDQGIQAVETLLKSPYTGAKSPDSDTRFYVLGLAPGGGSRIAVRYWHAGTVEEFSGRICQHFIDLKITEPHNKYDQAIDHRHTGGGYALIRLLRSIALEEKDEKLPPGLVGDIMRAILTGGLYPTTLLHQAVRRIRATREVKRAQAALLKAFINRKSRNSLISAKEEITMALDPENTNPGYRLGRLFAALEKIQSDAQPKINTTIRDRFYGAASSSPASVFPQLLKLKNHHLTKIENRLFRGAHEKRLMEIIDGLPPSMPLHLSMDDQARFAIGYYHQRQALYLKVQKASSI